MYNYLYVNGPEQAQNLRKAHWGGFFWVRVRDCMISEIILSISRLTDPREMGKRRNLTLAALLDDLRLSGQLRSELKRIRKLAKNVRKHRNRVVAHSDEGTAFREDALPTLQLAEIEEIISKLQDVHRKHRGASMGSSVSDYGANTTRGVENLVKRLEECDQVCSLFAHAKRSPEEKQLDWNKAREVFFPGSSMS